MKTLRLSGTRKPGRTQYRMVAELQPKLSPPTCEVLKGYEVDGVDLPFTATWGAFERAEVLKHREPFNLPKRWIDAEGTLDLTTPFNFASTADTIGGNKGSHVLNLNGERGVNFDRNRHNLVHNFVDTDEQARHAAVHSRPKHLYYLHSA